MLKELNDLDILLKNKNDEIIILQNNIKIEQDNRYKMILSSLHKINHHINPIYQYLVTDGNCYLNYSTSPITLFHEGIYMMTQYGNSSWREVKKIIYI